jgi:hypothetical protein
VRSFSASLSRAPLPSLALDSCPIDDCTTPGTSSLLVSHIPSCTVLHARLSGLEAIDAAKDRQLEALREQLDEAETVISFKDGELETTKNALLDSTATALQKSTRIGELERQVETQQQKVKEAEEKLKAAQDDAWEKQASVTTVSWGRGRRGSGCNSVVGRSGAFDPTYTTDGQDEVDARASSSTSKSVSTSRPSIDNSPQAALHLGGRGRILGAPLRPSTRPRVTRTSGAGVGREGSGFRDDSEDVKAKRQRNK